MKGMILAAGFGTRFRPITWGLPKPMIPVCNRPLIGWAVRAMVDGGATELIVNLHHIPRPIRDYLSSSWNGEADFEFSMEQEILGTGGALRQVRPHLESERTFLLMNGDTIQRPPFEALVRARESSDALAALLLRHPPAGEDFTAVWVEDGIVNQFGPDGRGESLMFAGAHAMSPRILGLLPDEPFSGLTEDVYIPVTNRVIQERLAAVVHDDLWFDVGKPTRYMNATSGLMTAMRDHRVDPPPGSRLAKEGLLHESSEVEGDVRESVVGRRSRVARGALAERSVLWDDCLVEPGATIRDSIVSHGVRIPRDARIRNATLCLADDGPHETELEADRVGDWLVRAVDDRSELVVEL